MTEQEWLAGVSPRLLLGWLERPGGSSERQLRLFNCACCRRIWHLLTDPRSRAAIEAVEQYADGLLTREKLAEARAAAWAAGDASWSASLAAARAAAWTATGNAARYTAGAARAAAMAAARDVARDAEQAAQASVLREIVGNPFQVVRLDPAWRTPAVQALAMGIYQERSYQELPILADALEDAGCSCAAILKHCRGTELHVRGCWAVDLLLNKR